MRNILKLSLLTFGLPVWGLMVNSPIKAMEWTKTVGIFDKRVTYSASGAVVYEDREKLLKLATATENSKLSNMMEKSINQESRPIVSFNSNGGNAAGGWRLGLMIRELRFDTVVPADAGCHSACTTAFMGGVSRTVVGPYGIHAMALSDRARKQLHDDNDIDTLVGDLQSISSDYIAFSRKMLGTSEVAEAAIQFGFKGIKLVTDRELRDWNVITVASRPSQKFAPDALSTINCRSVQGSQQVAKIICDDLALAREDIRIDKALAALKTRPDWNVVSADQIRWTIRRDTCATAGVRTPVTTKGEVDGYATILKQALSEHMDFGVKAIEGCVRQAYNLRARELEALVEYYNVRASQN